MKGPRHSSTAGRGQQIDWRNYKDLSCGFAGLLHPRAGRFAQPLFLVWGKAITFNRELSALWKLGQKRKNPSFTSMVSHWTSIDYNTDSKR